MNDCDDWTIKSSHCHLSIFAKIVIFVLFSAVDVHTTLAAGGFDKSYHESLFNNGRLAEYVYYSENHRAEITNRIDASASEIYRKNLAVVGTMANAFEFSNKTLETIVRSTKDDALASEAIQLMLINFIMLDENSVAEALIAALDAISDGKAQYKPSTYAIQSFLHHGGLVSENDNSLISICDSSTGASQPIDVLNCYYAVSLIYLKAKNNLFEQDSLVSLIRFSKKLGLSDNFYSQKSYIRILSEKFILPLKLDIIDYMEGDLIKPKKFVIDCINKFLGENREPPSIEASAWETMNTPYSSELFDQFLIQQRCLN